MKFPRIALMVTLVSSLGACAGTDLSRTEGTLAGAAGGAAAGAALGSGGIIQPALGALGGAYLGEEVAESDPLFD